MNRIQHWAIDTNVIPPSHLEVDTARVELEQKSDGAHALFAPLHYEPNYAYPLLIWLHGPGGNERQLMRVMPLVSMRNYVAVAPRATLSEGPDAADDSRPATYGWSEDTTHLSVAEQRVFHCIDIARQKYHIANHRMFIAGCQEGGTMALRLGMRFPRRFAGAACIGGAFPVGNQPLNQLHDIRHLPLLIGYGRDSRKYTLDQICTDLHLFHTAGLKVNVRQYSCGDDITTTMLSDLNVWMMELVTGSSVAKPDAAGDRYRLGELN